MKREEILAAVKSLAQSQGMYSRMYAYLIDLKENAPDRYDECMSLLEQQNFKDAVDMVMFFEC